MATCKNHGPPVIKVLPENQTFHLTEFHLALDTASCLASNGKPTKVLLPQNQICVAQPVNLSGGVSIEGGSLLFEKDAVVTVHGKGGSFSNTKLTSLGEKSVVVTQNSKLTLSDCSFYVSVGKGATTVSSIYVKGTLSVEGCMFNCWIFRCRNEAAKIVVLNSTLVLTDFGEPGFNSIFQVENQGHLVLRQVKAKLDSDSQLDFEDITEFADKNLIGSLASLNNAKLTITDSELSAPQNLCFRAAGSGSTVDVSHTKMTDIAVGVFLTNSAIGSIKHSTIVGATCCGVIVRNSAKASLNEMSISAAGLVAEIPATRRAMGLRIAGGKATNCTKTVIKQFSGYAIVCQGVSSRLTFEGVSVSNFSKGGIYVTEDGGVAGNDFKVEAAGRGLQLMKTKSVCTVTDISISGGHLGILIMDAENCTIKNGKCDNLRDKAVHIVDSTAHLEQLTINHIGTKAVGLCLSYGNSSDHSVLLSDCKIQHCSQGVSLKQTSKCFNEGKEQQKKSTVVTTRNTMGARCVLQNCAFVQCEIGFSAHATKTILKGCSFIMNKRHSIFLSNMTLNTDARLFEVRWPNYVEPYMDTENALSNNMPLLRTSTGEKAFYGSADFEPAMFLSVLSRRIHQARRLFESAEKNGEMKARVIMKSVSHMLVLIPTLSDLLVNRELLYHPGQGMFAATFKIHKNRSVPRNTLLTLEALLASWKGLTRISHFDSALDALNAAFEHRQVTEDVYDKVVAPLEEMRRICYINSKYNRRRNYLLSTAKEKPLKTWYFLEMDDDVKFRNEILHQLVDNDETNRTVNATAFHGSWIAQWAGNLLRANFSVSNIPESSSLRRLWADMLLDDCRPLTLIYGYIEVEDKYDSDMDLLIKSEALGYNTQACPYVLNILTFREAVIMAASMFDGQGALLGFFRRLAQKSSNLESLFTALSNVRESLLQRNLKSRIVLAVTAQYFWPDATKKPEFYRRKSPGYETCPLCLVQKLQPWNQITLQSCNKKHRFCRECLRDSVSTPYLHLWGKCPGVTLSGEGCSALATRSEMELAGIDSETIYNILRTRIVSKLSNISGWNPCGMPDCVGGNTKVLNGRIFCLLCETSTSQKGTPEDQLLNIRLLQGLFESTVFRGEGILRECYWCAAPYEKGDGCATMKCFRCLQKFNFSWGPDRLDEEYEDEGVGAQRYVPNLPGRLWQLGVFKDSNGVPLKLGKNLSEEETNEVLRRAQSVIKQLSD